MKICGVADCGLALYAEGVCRLHYDRLRRRGTTADPTPKSAAECEIEGCSKKVHSKGLCQPHYRKMKRNGDPLAVVPLGRPRVEGSTDHRKLPAEVVAENKVLRFEGKTTCRNDHTYTENSSFIYPEGHPRAGQRGCKVCERNRQNGHLGRAAVADDLPIGLQNGEKALCAKGHAYNATNTYVDDKGNRHCLICRIDNHRLREYGLSPETFAEMIIEQDNKCWICRKDFGESTPNVDHCHVTGSVRGLLCRNCNHGLGNFHDNPEFLLRAGAYLQKFGYEVIED